MEHAANRAMRLMVIAGLIGLSLQASVVSAGPAKTAQGIMVTSTADQNQALVENRQYSFNRDAAAQYFYNLWDGNPPTVSNCSGPGCPGSPTVPEAPPPNSSKVTDQGTGVAVANKCTFLDGGTLIGRTYTQTAKSEGGSGRSAWSYTYTYTYNIIPMNTVAAFTAWDLVRTTGGGIAEVVLAAEIAGESVVENIQNTKVGKKYSFSLRNSDGTSRVTDVMLTVADSTGNVLLSQPLATTLAENCPGCVAGVPGAVDFAYETNAGSNGNTSLLVDGDARSILNTDSFLGNNDGGTDGQTLAKAVAETVSMSLGLGTYEVTLTAIVKGNSAVADLPFTVAGTVHIIAPGCH
jgi:hypothetical protein